MVNGHGFGFIREDQGQLLKPTAKPVCVMVMMEFVAIHGTKDGKT